ncbi:cystatin-A2 isoform X2 [Parasteatoda tepidariorum]|uniref:cystatin-A2 isoform X2 n=1 Tax=Parasteatoda tepidariorum TaxID=114398 RepID=UPI001C7183FD|nr:cystatin-A2 isoform X2 [Parasteatoda tepidariorum]
MPMVGGTGDIREPDETVNQIIRETTTQKSPCLGDYFSVDHDTKIFLLVKDEVQTKTGLQFEEFTPINYRSQLVNGTNYFIKVSTFIVYTFLVVITRW